MKSDTPKIEQTISKVSLRIVRIGNWFEVSCDLCDKIVISGDGDVMGVNYAEAAERAAGAHIHKEA